MVWDTTSQETFSAFPAQRLINPDDVTGSGPEGNPKSWVYLLETCCIYFIQTVNWLCAHWGDSKMCSHFTGTRCVFMVNLQKHPQTLLSKPALQKAYVCGGYSTTRLLSKWGLSVNQRQACHKLTTKTTNPHHQHTCANRRHAKWVLTELQTAGDRSNTDGNENIQGVAATWLGWRYLNERQGRGRKWAEPQAFNYPEPNAQRVVLIQWQQTEL